MRRCSPAGARASSGRVRTSAGARRASWRAPTRAACRWRSPRRCDQLFVATEVNEWALCATLAARDPGCTRGVRGRTAREVLEDAADPASVIPPVLEESQALARFATLAAREAQPRLMALLAAAAERGLPHVLDETLLTLGAGSGGRDFPLAQLPAAARRAVARAARHSDRDRHGLERQDHHRAPAGRLRACARLAERLLLHRWSVLRGHASR